MAATHTKPKANTWATWGDDTPEKLESKPATKLNWQDQVKGLFNAGDQLKGLGPSGFMDHILNKDTDPYEPDYSSQEKAPLQRNNEFVLFSREQHSSQRKIEQETNQLLNELKQQVNQLGKSEKALTKEIAKITVEQVPKASLGIYFLRYLEWLLAEVRRMRVKIEEGSAWLEEFSNKKKKKNGYWAKYKKHGTSFGLSNERSTATQTG